MDRPSGQKEHEHYASLGFSFVGFYGKGNGKIGFAGAGGPDTEIDVVVEDVLQILRLIRAAPTNMAPANLHDDVVVGVAVQSVRDPRVVQIQMHALGGQGFRFRLVVHPAKNLTGRARHLGSTADLEAVTPADDVYAQSALELLQMLVERTANICQPFVISGFQPYVVKGARVLLGLDAQLR